MTDATKARRWWLLPLLFISLAINLLVVGVVVGWLVSPNGSKQVREFGPARGLVGEPFLKALPPAQRRELIQEARRESRGLRETRESLRSRFEAFLTAIRAQPYNPDAAANLLGEQRNAAAERLDLGERLLLERLEAMTVSERRTYADALEEALKRFRRQPKD